MVRPGRGLFTGRRPAGSKPIPYSITSSARATSDGEISSPSALPKLLLD
jgi:hypothetical protein